MAIESSGHSQGNPRLYELVEHAPKTGKSPTIWAWPEIIDWLRVAGQPVPGPWPPHQQRRPEPEEESLPTAVPDPQSSAAHRATNERPNAQRAEPPRAEPPRAEPQHAAPEPAAAEPAAAESPDWGPPDDEQGTQGKGYLDK